MALNLLRKTTPQSTFTIYDVNPLALSRFVNESTLLENAPKVAVAHNPKDLAERSVLLFPRLIMLILGLHYHYASRIRTSV